MADANKLTLAIPLYNEQGNVEQLITQLLSIREGSKDAFPHTCVLVNNGSVDETGTMLSQLTKDHAWMKVVHLERNDGYGGGIQAGFAHANSESTHLGWIPADLQYSLEDTYRVWQQACSTPTAFHKGRRTVRHDGKQTRFISRIYTTLVRAILCLDVKDVNGLPKIFPKKFYDSLKFPLAKNFHFDCQLMLAAQIQKIPIYEHPVTFYARRAGVSSWSGRRLRVYRETTKELLKFRLESKEWYRET